MTTLLARILSAAFIAVTGSCVSGVGGPASSDPVLPNALVGEFADDYGIEYTITSSEWFQRPRARYQIVRADTTARYLVARNDDRNPGDGGLWTRIDWIVLEGMPPYEWAFCLSAYDAPTMAAAEAVTHARRDTPRTGCNGHPFSRMRRRTPTSAVDPLVAPRAE